MDFKKLTARDMGAVIIAGIAGIACAYKGLGVWSLVFQLLTYFAINGIVLWTLSSWRMAAGEFAGMKGAEAKEKIRAKMIAQGSALQLYEIQTARFTAGSAGWWA